jgi:hypothetical protein
VHAVELAVRIVVLAVRVVVLAVRIVVPVVQTCEVREERKLTAVSGLAVKEVSCTFHAVLCQLK